MTTSAVMSAPTQEMPVTLMSDPNLVTLTLDETGVILECEGNVEMMFGYTPEKLLSRHVSILLPRLSYITLIEDGRLNARLHYLCRIGLPFQVRCHDHEQYLGYLSLTKLSNAGPQRVRVGIRRS